MKTLRYLSLTLFMCLLLGGAKAQYVTIPDTAFVAWLQANYPACMNGNQMDTTCADITSENTVGLTGTHIADLTGIQYFDNLNMLSGYGLNNTYIPAFPQNITVLSLQGSGLTNLPALPTALISLTVTQNSLTSLPALPSTLQTLRCDDNPIFNLPALPAGLRELYCGRDSLTVLPALPASLIDLSCEYNQITVLPSLPTGLQSLTCFDNPISVLPVLNNGLTYLYCGSPQLTLLPGLPVSLTSLSCSGGSFTALPVFPPLLTNLYLYNIPLVTLPTLPSTLDHLEVISTQISSLPALPHSLTYLKCSNNQLGSLPQLPSSLLTLYCNNNLLTSLPELPDTMRELDCSANAGLSCLPKLKHLLIFRYRQTAINCIPNLSTVLLSDPPLNTMPLCDPLNSNGCQVYWNISGNMYSDLNANCIQDNGETYVRNCKIKLLQNDTVVQQSYTSLNGWYAFVTDTGDYRVTIDTAVMPFNIICPSGGFDSVSVTPLDSTQGGHNFALQCKPGFDLAVQSINNANVFRPASFTHVNIAAGDAANFWNQTCNTNGLSGQVVLTISGPARYIAPAAGALTPVVSGSSLTYTINDWGAVNTALAFNIVVQTDTTAPLGTQVCFDVNVTPTAGDNNPANNHLSYCATVVNSYDPNIKEVYPADNLDINGNHWLTYTVRFQNTGSAPAENIYITDTIDSDVNIETFQLLGYSFAPQVSLKGNAVRFNFANINLADSLHDEPNSHGYVQYKVKVKDNATVGTVINNTAFIYFDFNAPVVTNTTTNTLSLFEGINTPLATATMQLYPNPANDVVMINLSDNLSGGTLTLSDVTGRSLNSISITSTHNQLNTAALSSGVYLITAVKGGTRVVQRLVIGK